MCSKLALSYRERMTGSLPPLISVLYFIYIWHPKPHMYTIDGELSVAIQTCSSVWAPAEKHLLYELVDQMLSSD